MNITEACGGITAEFPLAEGDSALQLTTDGLEISSGGMRKPRDPEPALYLTSEAAIAAWQREVLTWLRAEKVVAIKFLDGPHLDKWRITVADGKYTHRTAEDRYSVTARIGVIREAALAVELVVETVAPELPKPKPAKAAKKKAA